MEDKAQVNTTNRARAVLKRVGIPVDAVVKDAPTPPAQQAAPVPSPQPPAKIESHPAKVEEQKDDFDLDIEAPPVVEKKEEPKVAAVPVASEEPADDIDSLMDPKGSAGENFKRFRTKLRSLKEILKQKDEELSARDKRLKEIDDGLLTPKITEEQTRRIEELEVYERLYNFEKSPVAQQKFAVPIRREQENLEKLAKEHEVPLEALNAAFAEENSVKQDEILSKHFKTTVGAVEAKNILKTIKGIQKEYDQAKTEPAKNLQKLQEENERIASKERAEANEKIASTSKDGWSEALNTLRSDDRFKEIQYSSTDTEHNERFVRPILTKAGQQYGQTMRMLAENGLKSLPKDLSVAIARSYQLAMYSAAVVSQRDVLAKENAELKALIKTKTSLNRPGVNSTSAGGSNFTVTTPGNGPGPQTAGRRVLERVLNGKA